CGLGLDLEVELSRLLISALSTETLHLRPSCVSLHLRLVQLSRTSLVPSPGSDPGTSLGLESELRQPHLSRAELLKSTLFLFPSTPSGTELAKRNSRWV
ncbi:uncharacterized, partial [Tachysurus ichikawai]